VGDAGGRVEYVELRSVGLRVGPANSHLSFFFSALNIVCTGEKNIYCTIRFVVLLVHPSSSSSASSSPSISS